MVESFLQWENHGLIICMLPFVNEGGMETGLFEPEKDVGRAQFQQELNRWFESRGIIADLRSHLRHLMITALQNNQVGLKATDRNSPKAQALSLMIAEYLYRRGCHYTLSVFTSEVPSLVNFNPEGAPQGGRHAEGRTKRSCFQEAEVKEIFNALGMSSGEEELARVKNRYLEKGSDTSLVELFLETVVEMAMKLQIRRDVESHGEKGERLLSEAWSSRVVNILVSEKMTPDQVAAVEEAIFRITDTEIRKLIEVERRRQLQILSEREKRIQEYLKKHEEEIFSRLTEAEKELATRKDLIDEELSEREKHLTEMAIEWNDKHEEILRLSKNFHDIETENRNLQKKLKELEEDNKHLKTQGETQTKTIEDLRGEMNLLINKLKEATYSNSVLSERIQVLISRENKEAFVHHDSANQETPEAALVEIPALWLKNSSSDWDCRKKDSSPKRTSEEFTVKNSSTPHPEQCKNDNVGAGDEKADSDYTDEEGGEASLSSSSDEMILSMRKKIQHLEEQTDRLNQSYLEFKLKYISANSDSESPIPTSTKSPPPIVDVVAKETKFCQTDTMSTYAKIQKLTEVKEKKNEPECVASKKSEVVAPATTVLRAPTKRQLQNRDFFLRSRQLLQALEKQNVGGLNTTSSTLESLTCSSEEEHPGSPVKKSPVKSASGRTASICSNEEIKKKPSTGRKTEGANQIPKTDADCLSLLEEARLKSPQVSARMPLRQQILLSESEEEPEKMGPRSVMSPANVSTDKISVGKKSDSSW